MISDYAKYILYLCAKVIIYIMATKFLHVV